MPAALPVEVKAIRAKMKAADSHNRVVVVALEIEALLDTRLAHTLYTLNRTKGAEVGERFRSESTARKNAVLRKIEQLTRLARAAEHKGERLNSVALNKAKEELLNSFEAELRKLS